MQVLLVEVLDVGAAAYCNKATTAQHSRSGSGKNSNYVYAHALTRVLSSGKPFWRSSFPMHVCSEPCVVRRVVCRACCCCCWCWCTGQADAEDDRDGDHALLLLLVLHILHNACCCTGAVLKKTEMERRVWRH
jgi:hypothetical protein